MRAPTPFELRVYDIVRKIPRGRVATYGSVARALESRAFQAVGGALAKNPFAPAVPCHRVVAADGRLGGFNGHKEGAEPARKARLLAAEGVGICDGRIDLERFGWNFGEAESLVARGNRGPRGNDLRSERISS